MSRTVFMLSSCAVTAALGLAGVTLAKGGPAGPHAPTPPAEKLLGLTLLQDNGETDGLNAYSTGTVDALGVRRVLLDDIHVPGGQVWQIQAFGFSHVWNALPPGVGTGIEIAIRTDGASGPTTERSPLVTSNYQEVATGRVFFGREEAFSAVDVATVELRPGRHWIEATMVGPENNFWLTRAELTGKECWVDYEDLGGLRTGTEQFGGANDLNWILSGSKSLTCPQDLEVDGLINFSDILALLRNWGKTAHPFDLDESGIVDVGDVVRVLSAWGGCRAGACCLDGGGCIEMTADQCAFDGGTYLGDGTGCAGGCP